MASDASGSPFLLGTFLKITDAAIVEVVALAGFDFVIIDMEHGPIGYESAQNLVRAANLRGIKSIIRVGELNQILIQRALDLGCDGVQIPQINCVEDAKLCVEYSKFHPLGNRGLCRFVRAADYSDQDKSQYLKEANKKMVIVHIEGNEGINNLKGIIQVEGIDVFFLGPYDLSQSCGVPGDIKNKLVVEKMHDSIQLAKKYNKTIGTFTDSTEDIAYWRNLGVQYLAHSVDVGIIYNAYKQIKGLNK